MKPLPLVTEEDVRHFFGRKNVTDRMVWINTALTRAFHGQPRHPHYANAVDLGGTKHLRSKLGKNGNVPTFLRLYFERCGGHSKKHFNAGYRLKDTIAKPIEHDRETASLTAVRTPYRLTLAPVGETGILMPQSLPISVSHLSGVIDRLKAAILQRGAVTYAWSALGSSQSLETVYRQLLALRTTVEETGGLPNEYRLGTEGRWHGTDDHHPLTLCRPTRYLAFGERDDLWDMDLSSAHLAIAYGLLHQHHPTVRLDTLPLYLQYKSDWHDELFDRLRRRGATDITLDDVKAVPLAWMNGAAKYNAGSTNAVLRHKAFKELMTASPTGWKALHNDIHRMYKLLGGTRKERGKVSRVLYEWETRSMSRLGVLLQESGSVRLQAWFYDGFLLLQGWSNPTGLVEEMLGKVEEELEFPLGTLQLKCKSLKSLYGLYSSRV